MASMTIHQTMLIKLSATVRGFFQAADESVVFDQVMRLRGEAFRVVPGRKTSRVALQGKSYFVKQHFGVGWLEIIKNLMAFKKPILSAMTEVHAIEAITELGIATTPLVGYGQRGFNPARLQSFVMTEDLGDIVSLEDLCADWQSNPPEPKFKRHLIMAVAKLARTIHENGVNHRDFYLCHLCLDRQTLPAIHLYLIDLHRVMVQETPSFNGNLKDIAALYFSSMDIGLSTRDLLRFQFYYQPQSVVFWQKVVARSLKLYAKYNSQKFQAKLRDERQLTHE